MAITKVSRGLLSTGIVDNSNATAITIDSSENTAFSGSVSISHNSGDSLTLTKTTTEPSLRIEGDTDKDFVLTVSGEKLTITQNDGATDIALFDHDTKATTLKGNVEIAGEIDLDTNDDLRLRFYDGGTFKAGLQVVTSASDMISGSADGDFAIRAQGNMLFSAGGNLMQQALDTNGQFTLYGYNASHGIAVPHDQNTGYTNNLNAGTFGVLHRDGYDSYITANAYYYKTGGTAGWKAKYPAYKSGVLSMLDGRFVFGCSSAAPGGSGIVAVDGLQDRVRIDADGLKFGSDTAAANALDDYEEGDHTATISAASGSISLYSNYNNIAYTKVGRKVHVQGKLAVQSVSSPTGATTISLPFAVADQTDRGEDATHVGIGYFNGASIDTGFHTIYMEVIQGVSYVRPYVMKPSSTAGNAPGTHNLGDGYLAQGSDIYLNFTYYAA